MAFPESTIYSLHEKYDVSFSDRSQISGSSVKMAAVFQRNFLRIFKPISNRIALQATRRLSADVPKVAAFNDPRVQVLLKRITGRNLDKVLASRRESGVGLPSYKLMTDEELSLVCILYNTILPQFTILPELDHNISLIRNLKYYRIRR